MPLRIPAAPNPETFVSIDPKAGRISRELWLFFNALVGALTNRLAQTGSVTFAAATTAPVVFGVAEANASYDIWPISTDAKTYWASSKTTTGFTMNASASSSATIRYQLMRE